MDTFEDINDRIAYAKAKSKTEALSKRDQARETAQSGKSVVVFFNERYHLYLAPGHDPYQVRKDIDNFLNHPESIPEKTASEKSKTKPEVTSKPKDISVRDASGKFVSKKQKTPEPDTSVETKKKGFFGF